WPAVVACIGHWFHKSSRGVIFGLWNSHTSIGNILGAIIAGAFVEYNWGLSFIVPGVIMAVAGFLVFLFLTPYPEDVGISQSSIHDPVDPRNTQDFTESEDVGSSGVSSMTESRENNSYRRRIIDDVSEEESPLLGNDRPINALRAQKNAISFWDALQIPGVVEFSICLFFAKFVSYTFLYWLPRIIMSLTHESSSHSAYLSVPFDLGGIIGGVLAGYVVDRTGASAITCVIMLSLAIPSLYIYLIFGASSFMMNILLQIIAGTFVNGPYALITTAVSAELGTKVKSSNALATVTAIIDGTGSLGAAVGPFFAGLVSSSNGWSNVFFMVMIADGI
ncbi:glucose-6-phosphate exchanger SLC37A2-like, partial [Drosophila guanche]|uniref:glucose-6-phosphate exchanger SLC37A2-like n=1 Tax=Drosophila guanche TaxID=7266 RepID=UPI001470DEBA